MSLGGVGLNLVEANHVLFCDRWFNPTVHDQAMDRTHRIGQTKAVFVDYIDCIDTFDMVMKSTMERKALNLTLNLTLSLTLAFDMVMKSTFERKALNASIVLIES